MSLYDDLGVAADASQAEIKAAHRRKARETHPDHGGDPQAFNRVQRASVVLRDPAKREKYDRTGECDDRPEPDQHQQAIQLVSQMFHEAITICAELDTRNIIADIRHALGQLATQQAGEERNARTATERLKKALKRLKHHGAGPNFLANVLVQQIEAHDRALEQMVQRLAAIAEARELAKDFEWIHDLPAQQTWSVQWGA